MLFTRMGRSNGTSYHGNNFPSIGKILFTGSDQRHLGLVKAEAYNVVHLSPSYKMIDDNDEIYEE